MNFLGKFIDGSRQSFVLLIFTTIMLLSYFVLFQFKDYGSIFITNKGTNGYVIADAVQFLRK